MSEYTSLVSKLKEARNKTIRKAAEGFRNRAPEEKARWEHKRAFLDAQIQYFERTMEGPDIPMRVFISFNKANGSQYQQLLAGRLTERGFDVVTGFMKSREGKGTVLNSVLAQLKRSSIYLGILTKDTPIRVGDETLWSPAVWVVEEKGMALGLEKSFVLAVHQGVHEDFWKKTAPNRIHFSFDDGDFDSVVEEIVQAVEDRYWELQHFVHILY